MHYGGAAGLAPTLDASMGVSQDQQEKAASERPCAVALVGLGATGVAIGQSLRRRSDCAIVAAVDIAGDKVGRDVGEILGEEPLGLPVSDSLDVATQADVALIATTSYLEDVVPLAEPLLAAGINVVSLCEELGYPRATHPALADRLDRVARENGVSILGAGCNPGFVMDTLPLLLSGALERVERIEIRRTADLSSYGAIVEKFGLGLTLEEFDREQAAGRVIGHVGFDQSLALLGDVLGWEVDEVEMDPVRPAFVAPSARHGRHVTIEAGTVAAVLHAATARREGQALIDLAVHFGFFEPSDPVPCGDRYRLIGGGQTIDLRVEPGFDSFLTTIAVATNVVTAAVAAEPGLHALAELPVVEIASKGSRRVSEARDL